MITVFPPSSKESITSFCWQATVTLEYSPFLNAICAGEFTTGTYYLDGTTLALASQIYEDSVCTCAPTGYYREVGQTQIWSHTNSSRDCSKVQVSCESSPSPSPTPTPTPAPVGPTPSPSPTPSGCDAATGLNVENVHTTDFSYPIGTPSPSPSPSPTPSPTPSPAPISPAPISPSPGRGGF